MLILTRIHQVFFLKKVRLGGRFQTPVLGNTIKLPYLRTTPGAQKQKGKKDTLFKDREPQKPYSGADAIPYSAARTYIAHIWEYPPREYFSFYKP